MTDTILIQGGPMQLVSWDPGSAGGSYTVEGINMILGGSSWALEIDPTNQSCFSILPAGAPVPTGPVTPNVCHVGAVESVRPYGAPCAGCFNISFLENAQYIRDGGALVGGKMLGSQLVSYADLPGLRLGDLDRIQTSVPEPPVAALLALALVILTGRHVMSLLTRDRPRGMIEAQ